MPILSFEANPQKIKKGESSTLTWETEDCDNCVIVPPMTQQPVPPTGTLEVTPEQSTVYMLNCTCGDPPHEWTLLVEVEL